MIYLKTNPVGVDFQIQRAQQYLYDKLCDSLDCDIEAYGRAYVDIDNDGSVKPIVYEKNGSYREVLTDNRIKGLHFFFIENDEADILARTCMSSNTIECIVIIDDLTKVKNNIEHYQDEEIKELVKSYLKSYFDETVSVTKGRSALDGFDISKLQFIYPYFVFKITGKINNY